jgi:hypothetical protein
LHNPLLLTPRLVRLAGASQSYCFRAAAPHCSELEAAAKQAGWSIERDGATIVVRDVWTENEDHAAWLVATKVGLPLERVTVWAGRTA